MRYGKKYISDLTAKAWKKHSERCKNFEGLIQAEIGVMSMANLSPAITAETLCLEKGKYYQASTNNFGAISACEGRKSIGLVSNEYIWIRGEEEYKDILFCGKAFSINNRPKMHNNIQTMLEWLVPVLSNLGMKEELKLVNDLFLTKNKSWKVNIFEGE